MKRRSNSPAIGTVLPHSNHPQHGACKACARALAPFAHLRPHALAPKDVLLDGRVRQHAVQHRAGQLGGAQRGSARIKLALSLGHERACGQAVVGCRVRVSSQTINK